VLGQPIRVVGASRTDAGVHALGQIVSVCTESAMEPATVQRALNALLPAAVRVLDARDGPSGFDARRWSSGKRYLYLIDRGRVAHPLLRRFAWHVPGRLDPEAMRKAALTLRGRHDFSAFCAASGRGRTPFCTVGSIRLVARKERVAILVSADSFLHHMVRNVVGSLVEVGRGARAPEWIPDVLVSRDRTRAGPTAPAHGLTLLRVTYRRDKRDVLESLPSSP
jgi:tRNA pseudouridine38-40 synthase